MKLTVSEYAKRLNISVQTVYKKIKNRTLISIKEDGLTYVIVDSMEIKESINKVQEDSNPMIKELLKIIKKKDKEIKRLTKELSKAKDQSLSTMSAYVQKLEEIKQLEAPVVKDTVIDLEEVKPKKKKKKRKK